MIKQPELGQKISELRKAKGLTQEELVEKCNVSVRTIQRIETGEVTPRSYTIKTILAALDYDFSKISFDESADSKTSADNSESDHSLVRWVRMSWIFGIIYFVLGCLEGAADYFRLMSDEMIFGITGYVILKIFVLISVVIFKRGFVLVAEYYENSLLRIMAIMLMACWVLLLGYDIASVFYESNERLAVLMAAAVTFGGVGLVYGVALMRLEKVVGVSAKLAGIFEIAAACLAVTIVFALASEFLMVPAELLEIVVLFKAMENMQRRMGRQLAAN